MVQQRKPYSYAVNRAKQAQKQRMQEQRMQAMLATPNPQLLALTNYSNELTASQSIPMQYQSDKSIAITLPSEIVNLIIQRLSLNDLLKCRTVCTQWYWIAEDELRRRLYSGIDVVGHKDEQPSIVDRIKKRSNSWADVIQRLALIGLTPMLQPRS